MPVAGIPNHPSKGCTHTHTHTPAHFHLRRICRHGLPVDSRIRFRTEALQNKVSVEASRNQQAGLCIECAHLHMPPSHPCRCRRAGKIKHL